MLFTTYPLLSLVIIYFNNGIQCQITIIRLDLNTKAIFYSLSTQKIISKQKQVYRKNIEMMS